MEWVYVLADQMLTIILLVAVFELVLYVVLFVTTSNRTQQLFDSLKNMLRGIKEPPEKDSSRDIHDEISVLLDCAESIRRSSSEDFKRLLSNIQIQNSRKLDLKTHGLNCWNNVAAAIVQIFPLLGILGTILAIGQSMQGPGIKVDATVIVKAFTNAIDTTIFGLLFAVFYMIVDAFFQARANKLNGEIEKYRSIINYYETNGSSKK